MAETRQWRHRLLDGGGLWTLVSERFAMFDVSCFPSEHLRTSSARVLFNHPHVSSLHVFDGTVHVRVGAHALLADILELSGHVHRQHCRSLIVRNFYLKTRRTFVRNWSITFHHFVVKWESKLRQRDTSLKILAFRDTSCWLSEAYSLYASIRYFALKL